MSLQRRISKKISSYKWLCNPFVCLLLLLFLSSCNVVKRVNKGKHLIIDNTIIEDGKPNNTEQVNNIIIQKTNLGMRNFLSFPLKLHIYNLARPNIDSIINANILSDSSKVKRRIALLSKKQFDKQIESKKNFNSWLKRTGEAPVILDEEKTNKTTVELNKYYISKGWFDSEVSYEVEKDSTKRAKVTYIVTKNDPYILDSIAPSIKSASIDSLYPTIKKASLLKKGDQYDEQNFEKERGRINTYLRNAGFYHFGQDYISFVLDTIGTEKK